MSIGDIIYRTCPFLCPPLRCAYHWFKWGVSSCCSLRRIRKNYGVVLQRLRAEARHRKLKVLFLFDENSKWKCQRVYELMEKSILFEPTIALTKGDVDYELTHEEFVAKFNANRDFCARRNLRYVEAYSCERDEALDLSAFSPDIVFYPHTWQLPQCQETLRVSQFALTCYVPYYVLFYDAPAMDSQRPLHQSVFRYFLLSDEWIRYFKRKSHGFMFAGEMVGAGHPILDLYKAGSAESGELVIYAPHWSVPNKIKPSECYSTFLRTGEIILDYARKHSDIKWCFKPHPTLRKTLEFCPGWTKERIDRYYGEWESLGVACYTGDYPELFRKSYAMITDCASFLTEYSAMDKPLIHLVSDKSHFRPGEPTLPLLNSFYQVRKQEELIPVLDKIILRREDPNRGARQKAAREMNILDSHASENIVRYLENLILGG